MLLSLLVLGVLFAASGCSVFQPALPTQTPALPPTLTPQPSATPLPPTPTATPTNEPLYLDATVLSFDAQVPILIYHHFIPDRLGETNSMKMTLTEFKNELTKFYDNGFALVSLREWIDGTYELPAGKKPLIITIDDLWFGDQLFIGEDGTPSEYSGLGLLYQFSQEHPDFRFHAATFAVYGDKYYAVKQVGDQFYSDDDATWTSPAWRQKLGTTIAWAIDNGIEVYNHTLLHKLTEISDAEIHRQLWENDWILRDLLGEVGREDLIPGLENIIALPEGKWPETYSGKNEVLNYKDPEGLPVKAVLEAYNLDSAQFTPSFFSPQFNPYAILRITASPYFVEYILQNQSTIAPAVNCRLGPLDPAGAENADVLQSLIRDAVTNDTCSQGVYHVNGYIFTARPDGVELFRDQQAEN